MEPKTLIEHVRQTWPDVEHIEPYDVRDEGLLERHEKLIQMPTDIERELLIFRKRGITLQLVAKTVSSFLRDNKMEVNFLPHSLHGITSPEEMPEIERTEQRVLGLYGRGVETTNGFKQLGEIYYLVYYAETGLIIIFSYSGELQWAKK